MGSPAAWHPDPTGRHQGRYWDGTHWTEHVADQGRVTSDPLDPRASFPHPLRLQVERIDRQIHELQSERDALIAALADADAPATPVAETSADDRWATPAGPPPTDDSPGRTDPPPPSGTPVTDLPPAAPQAPGRSGFAAFLATAGVFLLAAAALLFTAASWTLMTATAQFVFLVVVTVAVAFAAVRLDRRELVGVGAAVGVLAVALAAVSVWSAQRAGPLWPSEFTWPLAAFTSTIVGRALSRWPLRWVTTAATASLLVTGITLTIAIASRVDLDTTGLSLLITALAVLTGATTPSWRTLPARRVIGFGALAGLTVSGLVAGLVPLGDPAGPLLAPLGAALLALAVLVLTARWSAVGLAPSALIVTATTVALAHRFGPPAELVADPRPAVWMAAGLGACAIAWASRQVSRNRQLALLVGAAPAAIAVLAATLLALEATGTRVVAALAGDPQVLADPWVAAGVVLGAVAMLALTRHPSVIVGLVGLVAVTTAGALPTMAAWPLLVAGGIGARIVPTRTRAGSLVTLGLGLVAIGIVAADRALLPIVTIAATALGAWVTWSRDDVPRTLAASHTILGTALVVATTLDALGVDRDLLLAASMATGLAAAVVAARMADERLHTSSFVALAVLTVTVPALASGQRAAGLLLVLAGVGWLAIAVSGHRFAAWVSATVASIGLVVILADLGIETIELYTIGPAILFALVGIAWLARDDTVDSVRALLPALTIALVPSLLVLAGDPRVVARLVGLTIAAGTLALVGVLGRLTAPTVAAAIVAIWVALSQVGIVLRTINPLIVFVVVGTLLVWLGASFERQRQRARRLVRRLSEFR